MDYYGGTVFHGGKVTCPVDDPTPIENAVLHLESLDPVFYARNTQGVLFFVAGKIGGEGPGAGCDGPVAKIARDIRVNIKNKSPLMLIDFKAGLEDIARGVITSLDLVIFVVDASLVSVEMAANMKDIVSRIRSHEKPATAHLENPTLVNCANRYYRDAHIAGLRFILNRIRSKDEEDTLTNLLSEKGIVINQNPSISTAWLKGTPFRIQKNDPNVQSLITALEEDIKDYYWGQD
jgi:CO dehydrogenase nickel-insertion accessory protein CooC1